MSDWCWRPASTASEGHRPPPAHGGCPLGAKSFLLGSQDTCGTLVTSSAIVAARLSRLVILGTPPCILLASLDHVASKPFMRHSHAYRADGRRHRDGCAPQILLGEAVSRSLTSGSSRDMGRGRDAGSKKETRPGSA